MTDRPTDRPTGYNTTASEIKAIINMDDLLKKCTMKLELSVAENEDLTSKLQVRNILN